MLARRGTHPIRHQARLLALLAAAVLLAGCAASGSPDTSAPPAEEAPEPDLDTSEPPAPDPDPGDDPDEVTEPPEDQQPAIDPAEVGADELGLVPVLMYHQLRDDGGGDFDLTPDELRAELTYLFDEGYVPIRTIDLVRGDIDVPAGMSPVVLTFDDSTRSQAHLTDDGDLDPDTAMGILIDVARDYDDVEPIASLYVNTSSLFGGGADGPDIVIALHELGMEIGNHTHGHGRLDQRDDDGVQKELATHVAQMQEIDPDIEVATMALPLGQHPENRELSAAGESDGTSYRNEGVLLVGAEPAPSPFHADFNPLAIPRILSSPDASVVAGSAWWFEQIELGETYSRYVSDGDPDTISFPEDRHAELDDALADRANPY